MNELLRLDGITKSFGETPVLKGIDLSVEKGEFITILGSSGCGKTTLLRIIAGLEEADEGRVFLNGRDVSRDEPHRRDVRMVFQNYALFPHMNVEANIGYSLRLKGVSRREIKTEVSSALELVQLSGYGKRMPQELSGGQRQRVAVARSLVNKPPLLLLDEPLGALDLQLRRQMQIELKRLQRQLGITFIYITHDQEEALTMSDRIAVMREGVFEQLGSVPEVYNHPRTAFAARFVGSANILRGKCGGLAGGALILDHPAGRLPVDSGGREIPEGSEICAAVRGEYIELKSGRDAEGLRAVITEKSFSGGQLRLTAVLEDSGGSRYEEITANRFGIDSSLGIGERVRVSWVLAEHAILVEDGGV